MKNQNKGEVYFQSQNEDNNEDVQQNIENQNEKGEMLSPERIDQLSALQILEFFFSPSRVQLVFNVDSSNHSTRTSFIWKVHNILGEIVINVEKYLIQNHRLINCIPFQTKQIENITYSIIKNAQQVPQSDDFLNIKLHIYKLYKQQDCDISKFLVLYSEFTKLSRKTLKFDMGLNFQSIQDELKRKENQGRMKINADINQRFGNQNCIVAKGGQQQTSHKGSHPSKVNGINTGKTEFQTISKDEKSKGSNKKWTPTEQANFCKFYVQTDSPAVCAQLMQKHVHADSRWKTSSQIEAKIYELVSKVFQKFSHYNTNNQAIKIFKQNKEIVMSCEVSIRKKIFKNIAIIYQNMLNLNDQKKKVVSQKILEVNRLCKDAAHMS